MENIFKQKLVKIIASVILITAGVLIYLYSQNSQKSPSVVKGSQVLAIEKIGLAEFNTENDTINNVSPQDKKLAEEIAPIFKEMGDAKDIEKSKQAVVSLGQIISKYPEYSDAYFLRATVSVLTGEKDYQKVLSDIDNAIKFHSSEKYKNTYDSTAGMYSLRAKTDILSNNYQQAINDLETAIKANPDNTNEVFNTGGVKPEDESNPTALQKSDLDLLIVKYPNDYRTYMFRGLFYDAFTAFDEKYFVSTFSDLKQAQQLNPSSALANYLLGFVYQQNPTRTKAGWSNISDMTGASGGYREKTNSTALSYFNAAIKLDSKFTSAYARAAESLYSLKHYPEAIPYYDKVVELDPTNAGALNDRGLAKTYINDNYGAINDFSDAIRLKKSKSDSFLDSTFTNRASAYIKVADYDNAIADYSRAIGSLFGRATISMSISQIRAIYPEFKDMSDQDLVEGLRQKYYPNISSEDFSKSLLKENKDSVGSTMLADNYIGRADTLLKKGEFKKAATEYVRVPKENHFYADTLMAERWKTISKTSNAEYAIDIQTLDFSKGDIVSLWLKSTNLNSQNYTQQNYQIDCSGRKIKSVSATSYDSFGNVINTNSAQDWQDVVPESIGEFLYGSMCK